MRTCCVPGCEKKHHAKGYCKTHYREFVLLPRLENTKCSVEGCKNPISDRFTKKKLCEMHGTRLMRNGDVNIYRKRKVDSYAKELIKSDYPLDYEINNYSSYNIIAKCFYGNYCHECGWDLGECEVHHIQQISNGGKNTLRNTIILCPNCHSLKHNDANNKKISLITKNLITELLEQIKN